MLGVLVRLVIKGFHLLVILELCAASMKHADILFDIIINNNISLHLRLICFRCPDVGTRDCRIALNAYSGLQAAGPSLPLSITTATWLPTTASLVPQKYAKGRRGSFWACFSLLAMLFFLSNRNDRERCPREVLRVSSMEPVGVAGRRAFYSRHQSSWTRTN